MSNDWSLHLQGKSNLKRPAPRTPRTPQAVVSALRGAYPALSGNPISPPNKRVCTETSFQEPQTDGLFGMRPSSRQLMPPPPLPSRPFGGIPLPTFGNRDQLMIDSGEPSMANTGSPRKFHHRLSSIPERKSAGPGNNRSQEQSQRYNVSPSYMGLLDNISETDRLNLSLQDPRQNRPDEQIPEGSANSLCAESMQDTPSSRKRLSFSAPFRTSTTSRASVRSGEPASAAQSPAKSSASKFSFSRFNPATPVQSSAPINFTGTSEPAGSDITAVPSHPSRRESVVSPFFRSSNTNPKRFKKTTRAEHENPSSRKLRGLDSVSDWRQPRSVNGLSFFDSPRNTQNQRISPAPQKSVPKSSSHFRFPPAPIPRPGRSAPISFLSTGPSYATREKREEPLPFCSSPPVPFLQTPSPFGEAPKMMPQTPFMRESPPSPAVSLSSFSFPKTNKLVSRSDVCPPQSASTVQPVQPIPFPNIHAPPRMAPRFGFKQESKRLKANR